MKKATKEKVTAPELTSKNEEYGLSPEQSKNIIEYLSEGNLGKVKEIVQSLHPADIADLLDIVSQEQRKSLVETIRDEFDPEILVDLDNDVKEETLEILGVKETAEALTHLETDDAIDVIEDLDKEERQEILDAVPKEQRDRLEESLSHPEDSAGRLTDKNVISVPEFWDVGQTIDYLRSENNFPEEFYQIFVINPQMKPIGGVKLSQIIRSKRPVKMTEIMNKDIKIIKSDMDQEEVAFIFRQYGLVSAPVVNDEERMIGIITLDDIVDVMDEEAQEDIMHLGGVSETDLHSSFGQTIERRFPWLLINLITAVIASFVIAMFEGAIEKVAALAVLMPIAASMGGNAGTQTLTIAVRAIATKEINSTNAMRVVGKEVIVGSANGVLFAIVTAAVSYMWYEDVYLSVVFASAMVVTLIVAGLAGAMIPIGLVKLKVDPAIASSIFLTTVTDVIAFGVFLGLATMFIL